MPGKGKFSGIIISMSTNSNILYYLKEAAEKFPDRVALDMSRDNKDIRISFKSLWNRVDAFSVALREKGLKPLDRCIIMIPMSIDLYVTLLSVIKMGAVAVFVDPWIKHQQIAAFSAFAQPRAFIGIAKSHYLRLLNTKLLNIPLTISDGPTFMGIPAQYNLRSLTDQYQGDGHIYAAKEEDPALITFTSGSSGIPKGANRTHGFLTSQYKTLSQEFHYDANDIDMPMFPIFALSNIAAKITSIIPDMDFKRVSEVNAHRIIDQMRQYKVTTCTASPPFFDRLAEYINQTNRRPPTLRKCLTGGAPVNATQLKEWRKALPNVNFKIVYGSTEAEPVAHISLEERLKSANTHGGYCVGIPSSLVRCKVIKITKRGIEQNSHWQELLCRQGEVGELIVSGDHVCKEYYQNQQAFKENKLVDPSGVVWHRMGDTGYFDEKGAFWLVGRVHSTIIRQGKHHHAQLIEETVKQLVPRAQSIAALGLPDHDLQEKIVVVLNNHEKTISAGSIRQKCQQRNILVDQVLLTEEPLPLDPRHNSKIDYNLLRQRLLNGKLPIYDKA